jgi:Tfp pilus assembly protein FimV
MRSWIFDRSAGRAASIRRMLGRSRLPAVALAAALIAAASGATAASAQVPGASYGEGPGATGVRPGVAASGPARSGAEGPGLVEARQLPRTGDGSAGSAESLSGTAPVAAVGGIALLGAMAAGFALRRRQRTAR